MEQQNIKLVKTLLQKHIEQQQNITLVKKLLQNFLSGDNQAYIDGCHPKFIGKIFSGLIPGGDLIQGKEQLAKVFDILPKYIDIIKFEPVDWCAVDNNVYFTVNWEFIWKPTDQLIKTSANVKKIIVDGKIKEKYHIVNFTDVAGVSVTWSLYNKSIS
tara:strand:- start:245 stop:718 length:474 start_codon:yes stop_codon:yes gene_type:complete